MTQMTAASFPITFGDFTYSMRPLTDKDTDELNNWLRSSFVKMARDTLTPDMKESEREEILGVAMSRARRLSFLEGEGAKIIGSIEGVSRVLWQGCRADQPEVSWEIFRKRIWALKDRDENSLASDITTAMAVWQEINVGKSKGKKSNDVQSANGDQGAKSDDSGKQTDGLAP